jgi:4-amino-4-deoxy-L-arabinose transferase-like glycosyltransferase
MKRLIVLLPTYIAIGGALLISPMVALFVVFIAVSLLVSPPRRHRPLRIARAGAAVGGTASGSPTYSPKRPAVTASATG